MKLKCIIIRKKEDLSPSMKENKSFVSSSDSKVNLKSDENLKEEKEEEKKKDFINSKYYDLYIIKNSKHFTISLAEWGLKQLNEEIKFLELSEIQSVFTNLNLSKPEINTWGDILFLINYYYLNTVVDNKIVIKIEQLKRTYNQIIESNKNFDDVFDKWLSELKDKNIEIPWKNFV